MDGEEEQNNSRGGSHRPHANVEGLGIIVRWKGPGKLQGPELSGVRSMFSGAPSGCSEYCRMVMK